MTPDAQSLIDTLHQQARLRADSRWRILSTFLAECIPPQVLGMLLPPVFGPRPVLFSGDAVEAVLYLKVPGHEDILVDCEWGAAGAWSIKRYLVVLSGMSSQKSDSLDMALLMAREVWLARQADPREGPGEELGRAAGVVQ